MAVDGHAKKVYKSGNQKFTAGFKASPDLPASYQIDGARGANHLMTSPQAAEFDTYYGGGGGNDENDI